VVSPFIFPADEIPYLLLPAIESLILLPHEILFLADTSLIHSWKKMTIVPLQVAAFYWMFPVPLITKKGFRQLSVFTGFRI